MRTVESRVAALKLTDNLACGNLLLLASKSFLTDHVNTKANNRLSYRVEAPILQKERYRCQLLQCKLRIDKAETQKRQTFGPCRSL